MTSETSQEPQEQTRETELTEQLQRLQAEFSNYRRRAEADAKDARNQGKDGLFKELFAVIDSIELALKHRKDHACEVTEGLELIYSQLLSMLEQHGITKIPMQDVVDAKLHEVYLTETKADAKDGAILDVLQSGYARGDTVLRTAKVKAARKGPQ